MRVPLRMPVNPSNLFSVKALLILSAFLLARRLVEMTLTLADRSQACRESSSTKR